MFKPKKVIPYLAAGLTLSGCKGEQSRQELRDEAVKAFCLQVDVCYDEDFGLAPGACESYYSAYLDALRLVREDGVDECLAAWETTLRCIASSPCGQNEACSEEDGNGNDLIDRACR
ncbi:MAG: hypothetical protein KJO40_20315 [Deltaproteobacteria bacterium]|nr:hypothetical protein [Deltaproteobacteria bacterium]NND29200.1 hypothetical protein [Myxococcales bacterium]MBT8464501.1 hypothetical protein [Deltaproteobacteria bacterium]MBT8480984.1 hypothetical protein [Deltaproteobacteria bacterium]NNL23850.1 hypothetical protein [Myxococcales bacterium]